MRADRNKAGESGGVTTIDTTATVKSFSAANCSRNEALRGGIAYVMGGALIKVNTSKFERNKASSGGCFYIDANARFVSEFNTYRHSESRAQVATFAALVGHHHSRRHVRARRLQVRRRVSSTTPTSSTSSAQCLVTTRPRRTAAPGAWLALDSSSPSLARSLTQTLQPSSLAAISSRRRRASPIRHSSATLRPREVRSTFIPLRI